MNKKIIFKINKELDFQNHLIGSKRILNISQNISPEIIKYFKSLQNEPENLEVFLKKTTKFYSNEMKNMRVLLVKQTQEMWDLVENKYFHNIEKIHQKKFPFKQITGILSTTPMIYGYNFNINSPWFACPSDSPIKAIHIAMHEIMHSYFHKYFMEEYKEKFELNDEQIWVVKEALTILLDLEFNEIRMFPDKGKQGHEILREKIKEDWLKYKDIIKVLDEACFYIKNLKIS